MKTVEEKNRWLTEKVLRECWHEWRFEWGSSICEKCDKTPLQSSNPNFYSSDEDEQAINFFRLWRAIQEKKWFEEFYWDKMHDKKENFERGFTESGIKVKTIYGYTYLFKKATINCSVLADAIGEYFKWEEVK